MINNQIIKKWKSFLKSKEETKNAYSDDVYEKEPFFNRMTMIIVYVGIFFMVWSLLKSFELRNCIFKINR